MGGRLGTEYAHNVCNWQQVVRRYFDSKDVTLYLTGSSAKLLSREIHTSLRGRSLAIEIAPYNFPEYLMAHQLPLPKQPFGQGSFDQWRQHLQDYLTTGGFPAVQHLSHEGWRLTLQGYIDTVILRDIIERHQITNVTLLKYLTRSLLKHAGCLFSVNKFYHDIKSQGYKVGKDTIYQYIEYLQDAFLLFSVPFYSVSERMKQNKPKKIYAVDVGLVQLVTMNIQAVLGKLFENFIYLYLRRARHHVYYYHTKAGYKIDFVTIDKDGHKKLWQVVWDMSDKKTLAREQRALQAAREELDIKGTIISPRNYLEMIIMD